MQCDVPLFIVIRAKHFFLNNFTIVKSSPIVPNFKNRSKKFQNVQIGKVYGKVFENCTYCNNTICAREIEISCPATRSQFCNFKQAQYLFSIFESEKGERWKSSIETELGTKSQNPHISLMKMWEGYLSEIGLPYPHMSALT